MTYQEQAAALADRSSSAVLRAWLALEAAEFIPTGASIVAAFNQAATVLADMSLASLVGAVALGLTRSVNDLDRLSQAFDTATADPEHARPRIERLATAEPLHAGRAASFEAMKSHPQILGWTRRANPDACELCKSLDNGSVLPKSTGLIDHPGCKCVAIPVLKEAA